MAGVARMLYHVDAAFGDVFHAMRDGYLDIGHRPNKTPAVEAWFFPRAGMPYVHVSTNNTGSVLHESGHAIHFYLSFQAQGSMWNFAGLDEFQEFAAVGLEMLAWPYYEQTYSGLFTASESVVARQHALHFYVESLTSLVMHDAFEHWVYGEAKADVTAADFDAKWLELKQRFMPWDDDASTDEAMTGWQRWAWSLFRMPLYLITYPIAVVGVSQLSQLAEIDRGRAIENYKTALVLGNTRPLTELFRIAGVEFPYTLEAIAAAAHFIVDESRKTVKDQ
jgi:oligoendopeptidase F